MSQTRTIVEMDFSDFDRIVEERSRIKAEHEVLGHFRHRTITTRTVAEILDLSEATVYRQVKAGKIEPLNPGSSKLRFNLVDILKLDLKKISVCQE